MGAMDERVDDDVLVAQIRDADSDSAFRQLFQRYVGPLLDFAQQLVHAPDLADDIVADVFAALWEQRKTLRIQSVRAYLFGAVRNRAYTVLHNARRSETWTTLFLTEERSPGLGEVIGDPETLLDQEERRTTLMAAIAELPYRSRAVIWLRWINQLSFSEIAETMGTTEAAIRMQHSRALAQLRGRLEREK
jgi:RNA polymerase sigma-70 factor (ECF subfamily)